LQHKGQKSGNRGKPGQPIAMFITLPKEKKGQNEILIRGGGGILETFKTQRRGEGSLKGGLKKENREIPS